MRSIKTLALLETRKLSRYLGTQQRVLRGLETVATDFFSAFPDALPPEGGDGTAVVLIGSVRGFCGDFNEVVLEYAAQAVAQQAEPVYLIGVGRKLADKLEQDTRVVAMLDGPAVVEEVDAQLARLVDTFIDLLNRHPGLSLSVIYRCSDQRQPCIAQVIPPFRDLPPPPRRYACAPMLTLTPAQFASELVEQYLFAVLHAVIFTSLMAENQQRIQHLEGAIRRLGDETDKLKLRYNALRQEDITEEIEMILLNVEMMHDIPGPD